MGVGLAGLLSGSALVLKLYPALVSASLLVLFGVSLACPPALIFRFALRQDKSIRGSLAEKAVEAYCRKVTWAWCVFFAGNGGLALWTALCASEAVWAVYNGGVSYILIGAMFAGEFMTRKAARKNMPRAVPLSRVEAGARAPGEKLCFGEDGSWKTWGDFLEDTAKIRRGIQALQKTGTGTEDAGERSWLLCCEDYWHFLVSLAAVLQCGSGVTLMPSLPPERLRELEAGHIGLLTDQPLPPPASGGAPNLAALAVEELLAVRVSLEEAAHTPPICPEKSLITLLTSGSTGKPKAVTHRLVELEKDNLGVLEQWGADFYGRRLCSTVSPQHIYGVLFAVALPFTAGLPFRRERVRCPEELALLSRDPWVFITVPAFLKRIGEDLGGEGFSAPGRFWIFTSGGAVDKDTAARTEKIFGICPLEVYGSTESNGIAWRRLSEGEAWTLYPGVEAGLDGEGRLTVRSPYIADPAGLVTGDLAELLEGRRLLLRGRADSVVKIEEKRISLPEVEGRLMQSGLLEEACVLPLSGKGAVRRQILAAVLVLNEEGRKKFRDQPLRVLNSYFSEFLRRFFESVLIPKKWRYLEVLPCDAQGKKSRNALEACFADAAASAPSPFRSLPPAKVLEQKEGELLLELTLPEDSLYFDGHFPSFPLLSGVAQMEIVLRLAARHLGSSPALERAKRIKFSRFIRPGARVCISLKHVPEERLLSFKIMDSAGGKEIFSSGSLLLGSGT